MANKPEKIAVLGAGTMGAGIAQVAAQAGFETIIYDVKQEFIDAGLARVQNFLKGSRERGGLRLSKSRKRSIVFA
jgi:3-hydroxyacyl-CoA dehydrogenase